MRFLAFATFLLLAPTIACSSGTSNETASLPTGATSESFVRQIDGVWTGSVEEPGLEYPVKLTSRNGVITTEYPSLPCTGELQFDRTEGSTAIFIERVASGQAVCLDDIVVVLDIQPNGQLHLGLFLPNGQPAGAATLNRQ